ncbi:wall-associated receptor kinase-like 8 [Vigna unguiculata]|uniref:wall-associated receptor kinase-like 8 n=1 Tax=Vigna unguiculata TaxID=3917 RepID=UPI0010171AFB|nr:wall-associated receptor kinase-like 8 [Vigna unguiculata]
MILKLVLHFIVLAIWSVLVEVSSSQEDYPSVAKPGCDSRCGDLQIPFPFGMKSSECYAEKWFEIECRNSATYHQTPYLKSIGVEVTSIDVGRGTVTIIHPVYRSNCGTKDSPPVNLTLEGSPFVYSQEQNKFVAAGCNIIAFLQVNGTGSSGCVSICDKDLKVDDIGKLELKNNDCNGKNCCQNSLPPYLKEYSTQVKGLKENEMDDECSYAMVVQQHLTLYPRYYRPDCRYYPYNPYNPYHTPQSYDFSVYGAVKDLDLVPAVLEWEILNNFSLKLPAANLSECVDTNITSSLYKRSGQRCSCVRGPGNPYFEGGCSDSSDSPPYSDYWHRHQKTIIAAIKGMHDGYGFTFFYFLS